MPIAGRGAAGHKKRQDEPVFFIGAGTDISTGPG
jgi:hypothetical protein